MCHYCLYFWSLLATLVAEYWFSCYLRYLYNISTVNISVRFSLRSQLSNRYSHVQLMSTLPVYYLTHWLLSSLCNMCTYKALANFVVILSFVCMICPSVYLPVAWYDDLEYVPSSASDIVACTFIWVLELNCVCYHQPRLYFSIPNKS